VAAVAEDLVDNRGEGGEARSRSRESGRRPKSGAAGQRSIDDHVVLKTSKEVWACRVSSSDVDQSYISEKINMHT